MTKAIIRTYKQNLYKSISLANKSMSAVTYRRGMQHGLKCKQNEHTEDVTNFYASIISFQIGNNSFLKWND